MITGSTLADIVQTGLNRALQLDPAGRVRFFQSLEKPVRLRLTTPTPLTLTLRNNDPLVQVEAASHDKVAVTIAGGPIALAAFALGDPHALDEGRLSIDGEYTLASGLHQALAGLAPDWEAAVAQHLGDVPAHFLGKRLRGAVQWSRQAMASLTANLEEYIHEEARTLPGRHELADRTTAITDLQQRTETLDAKLAAVGNHTDSTGSTTPTETL